jgi:hypothetical protein
VIARGEGDDAASGLVCRQARQRVVGAAELEGTAALLVLTLEKQVRGGAVVDETRRGHRRAMRGAGDLLRRAFDVDERG